VQCALFFLSVYINLLRHLKAHVKTSRHELPMPLTLINLHFHFLRTVQISTVARPPSGKISTVSFHELKRQGSKVNYQSPPSAQVKKEWSYTSAPPYIPSRRGQVICVYFMVPRAYWAMLIYSLGMFEECICFITEFAQHIRSVRGFRTCIAFW